MMLEDKILTMVNFNFSVLIFMLFFFFFFNVSGYNPIFDVSFEFQVNLPELALVRFAVLDDEYIGDEFIGQYTIPFDSMLTGW